MCDVSLLYYSEISCHLFIYIKPTFCFFSSSSSQVSIKGGEKLVDGEFYNRIIVDDSFWTLEDGEVVISIQKDNKMEWWKCVIKGDPEINTQKVCVLVMGTCGVCCVVEGSVCMFCVYVLRVLLRHSSAL